MFDKNTGNILFYEISYLIELWIVRVVKCCISLLRNDI